MSDYPNRNGGGNGNRRRNRNRPRGPRPEGPRPTREGGRESRNAPSFFQKILGFFGLGQKSKSRPQADRSSSAASGPRSTNDNPRPMREPRESREPREARPRREAPAAVNPADITTDRLYVGNLSYDATESDLFELFNGVGAVKNAEVVVNSRTQRSKGFAFVTMGSVEEARRAVQELSGKDFMGRPLQLSGAKPNTRGEDSGAPSEQEAHAA
ncbi:RNA recognition motif domain-containing protein [Prosthecobacter sp.]|uniref:RNA recognition motif domain-containing protein n=1 Tax=Prosthecobacter sp. TaxID=1965333 RepID=UPI0037830112